MHASTVGFYDWGQHATLPPDLSCDTMYILNETTVTVESPEYRHNTGRATRRLDRTFGLTMIQPLHLPRILFHVHHNL
jgi:hypothetical protein